MRGLYLNLMLFFCLIVASIIFLLSGQAVIGLKTILDLLSSVIDAKSQLTLLDQVVLYIKLPILVAALLSGLVYGFCGALMQGLLRNPLADPGILGVSSGASLMVVLGLWFFRVSMITSISQNIIILALAMIGSAMVLLFMYVISNLFINGKITGVLLAGIALSSMFSAILMLAVTYFHGSDFRFAISWLMGGIDSLSWSLLGIDILLVSVALAFLLNFANALDLLILGEINAKASGVDFDRLLIFVLIGLSLIMAVAVSISGPIAFIGLVSPHIVRALGIHRYKALLISSGLIGGALVITSETIARYFFTPYILPLGAITSLIGAPFFLVLLWRFRRMSLFI